MNKLYFGDNLTVLRDHVKDESVDLIYLDPPFNSRCNYNVLFKGRGGAGAEAQVEAFRDTWHWGPSAEQAYDEIQAQGGELALVMSGMRRWLGDDGLVAYLAMMGVRLIELYRVLKPTGSIYLHCDPTASHYLKVLLDAVFGDRLLKNEVIWCYKRYTAVSSRFQRLHDTIFFYTKSEEHTFNLIRQAYGEKSGTRDSHYKQDENGHWFRWQKRRGQEPYKIYLSEGVRLGDWWEIPPINASARERLGYPTQKPLALLERIICSSSNEGDVILDPFCGCGTTIDAAQQLNRQWLGIDVTHYAVTLIERRLAMWRPGAEYTVHGRPTDLEGAIDLARRDKHQFQWWAAWRLGAQRYREEKRGADRGVDGRARFKNGPYGEGWIIISVKGGDSVSVPMVRDLRGVIEREEAEMGVLITLAEPTRPMIAEAAAAGFVQKSAHGRLPRIQIVTVEDLLDGRLPVLPPLPTDQMVGPWRAPTPTRRRDRRQPEFLFEFAGSKQVIEDGEFVDPRFISMG